MSPKIRRYDGSDALFIKACELAEVTATQRQYRKWSRGFGRAFARRSEARAIVHKAG